MVCRPQRKSFSDLWKGPPFKLFKSKSLTTFVRKDSQSRSDIIKALHSWLQPIFHFSFFFPHLLWHSHNEAYGIRAQRPRKGWDQGSQPRDLESQRVGSESAVFYMKSGIRLTTKTGSGIKILIVFGIRDQQFG